MDAIRNAFGARIRNLRQEQGLTQEDLAASTGLHTTYVSGVERGKYNVSLQNIAKFAKSLDVPVARLFPATSIPVEANEADRIRFELNKTIRRLSLGKLRLLLKIVKELAKGRI